MSSMLPKTLQMREMSLAKRLLTSTGWMVSATYLNAGISFVGNIFLARLLSPNDFGIYALAASLLALLFMISGFGTHESIVQCRDDGIQYLIPTAFWMTIGLGLGLSLSGSLLALYLLPSYGETVARLIMLLSWLNFAGMVGNAYGAVLKRELNFKLIAMTQIISTFISFGVAGLAAYLGWGIWSLFVREATWTIVVLAGFAWSSGYRLQFRFDIGAAHWVWAFGWKVMGNRIGEVLFERVDKLVAGSFLGTTILGQYSLAYRLAFAAHQFSYGMIQSISLSAFSSVQQQMDKLRLAFEKLYYWLFRFVILLGLLVWFCGAELVVVIYGAQWQLAGSIFQAMAVFLMLLPLETSLRSFLTGSGYINSNLRVRVWQLLFFFPAILVSAYWGDIIWVVWSINASIFLSWLLAIRYSSRVIIVRWSYLMQKPLIAGFITFALVTGITYIGLLGQGGLMGVLLRGSVVAVMMILTSYLTEHHSLRTEWAMIRARLASS
jgi:O-antigen/teichoic acid export membrane protein